MFIVKKIIKQRLIARKLILITLKFDLVLVAWFLKIDFI